MLGYFREVSTLVKFCWRKTQLGITNSPYARNSLIKP